MKKLIGILIAILYTPLVFSETTVTANLQGEIIIKILDEEHFRHSLDCYVEGKGNETHDLGEQPLPLSGETKIIGTGFYQWSSALVSPFQRNVRNLRLTVNSAQDKTSERVLLQLTDTYSVEKALYSSTKCGHHDGITRPEQARIEGNISVQYKVPPKTWAVLISRKGAGIMAPTNMKPLVGLLNEGFDTVTSSEEQIFWVQPGSTIIQTVILPSRVLKNAHS